MSYREEVAELVHSTLNRYRKTRGDILTKAVTGALPETIGLHLEGILEDETVIREVQWWLIEKEEFQMSFDDIRRVLGGLGAVLKTEEPKQKKEEASDD